MLEEKNRGKMALLREEAKELCKEMNMQWESPKDWVRGSTELRDSVPSESC